jgi:hypothetical protein
MTTRIKNITIINRMYIHPHCILVGRGGNDGCVQLINGVVCSRHTKADRAEHWERESAQYRIPGGESHFGANLG